MRIGTCIFRECAVALKPPIDFVVVKITSALVICVQFNATMPLEIQPKNLFLAKPLFMRYKSILL